jgi:PAS domain S-box-containing protein
MSDGLQPLLPATGAPLVDPTRALVTLAATQRAILDALPAHVCLLDTHRKIVAVNEAWRQFGLDNPPAASAALGQNYLEVCDRAVGADSAEAGAVAIGTRRVLGGLRREFSLEYPCHAPNHERWFRLTVTPVEAGGAVCMHVDVTGERLAAQALRVSEANLRAIVVSEPECVKTTSLDGLLLDMNPAGLRMIEAASLAEIRGRSIASLVHPDDRDAFVALHLRAAAGEPGQLGFRVIGLRGTERWLETHVTPLRQPDGSVLSVLGVTRDVTERKVAEDERRKSQMALRIASRVAKLGGWIYALADDQLTWSEETAAMRDEPPGFSPTLDGAARYYAPEFVEQVAEAFAQCVLAGTPFEIEAPIVTALGRHTWVRVIGEAVRADTGEVTHVQGALQDITDQKAAAEEIRSLGVRLQETLESISDAFFTVDAAWQFTYLNAAAERLMKRKRTDLLGRGLWAEFPDALGGPSDRAYHQAMNERVPVHFEEFYAPLHRWLEVDAYPSRDSLAVYFRDVTERRKSREVLRASEERFRLLVQATTDASWDVDLVASAVWWSDGFIEHFGTDLGSQPPTMDTWNACIHPEDRGTVLAVVLAAVAGDAQVWSQEYRLRRKDGSYAHVLDRAHIVRDDEGKAVRMMGGLTDLTDRKRAEERLREQATLLDKANDAIIVRDLDHHVLYWNRSAERMYGWTADAAMGRRIEDLLYPDPTAFLHATAVTTAQGEWVGEMEQRTQAGNTLVVEGRWTLVRDDHGEPSSILAINTDVTQRKKLEAQFLRAQRMESIGALAGGIAHDLNNALVPILMTVSALRMDEKEPSRREDLDLIASCAQHSAHMVRQLLTFARGSEGRRETTNLAKVAAEVQAIVRDTFPRSIAFRLDPEPSLWDVEADPTQIHQLLMNLCVNARDAMPQGGTLTVAIEHAVVDEVYTDMNLEARPGPYVVIRVEDTGTGMTPEVLDHIFEPFFTTKEVGKGTGLGLSTTHAIAKSHGGFIHVYSEIGKGTRFKVYLPADVPMGTAVDPTAQTSSMPRGNGELVLVVDDEEKIRLVARRTLERFGYRVLLASNGAEAVSRYAQHGSEIAVVLTDMAMPVMDGPATIVALRSLNPHVRIVGSSGLDANGYLTNVAGTRLQHFLPKPYTAEVILQALRSILTEGA